MKRTFPVIFFSVFLFSAKAQDSLSIQRDSSHVLNEVTVKAYEYGKPITEVPVAIGIIGKKELERFNGASFVSAVNTIAGVRMEERSPGSYRLSIRGSTLRSPFGVRNVKMYWNDLPFTDPGGNTYLNLLDVNSVQQMEVIKGPGASLYGAGTGGVILLKNQNADFNQNQLQFAASAGSYGLRRYNAGIQTSSAGSTMNIQYAHQQADGYREQSRMQRDVIQTQGTFRVSEKRTLSANVFFADLYYQTPGALTKQQYEQDPRQARPTAGANLGAVDQHATVYNKTFYGGLSHEYAINSRWSNRTGVYGTFTQFENPTLRNYERKVEQSFGGRSVTQYTSPRFSLNAGAEFQQGFTPDKTYDNNHGQTGNLQTDDEISSTSALVFAQGEWMIFDDLFLTGGGSYNFFKIDFTHLPGTQGASATRNFAPVFSPRIALLKKFTPTFSVYGSVSQGFSPPTVAELFPSTAIFSTTLNPEKGTNYELGFKGRFFNNTVALDITAYDFELNQAIVSRRDTTLAGDPEYFINAGNTSQKGLEVTIGWTPLLNARSAVTTFRVWGSVTANHYRFRDYEKDNVSFTNNKLTGVAPNIVVAGVDIVLQNGLYANMTFNFTDRIPLDDANDAFANSYKLLGMRAGYRVKLNNIFPLDIFGGADNLLDEHYSLGNDLNAAASRFYNAAPPRNFYIGLKSALFLKKKS